ncbi:major facilitator superfamily MFS_1 [Catenulispora acidiphila DSM 44928]|uniref:Major facilitator superfamily MFS_1 n=1 Tax=Catenulispora acidiphila (strain DSM 44928 / JCM 14897 / NBRC 102108 / NRRL B-24433 / ID139908) TaxID=479433 RepID=C7PWB1_CATAD|nr:MFS transporter [Catenulispora acidiphila]ACU73359.1 major facilitator superfamily MFS_1 [Catenulispora acidiphila DSM 44928]
MTADTRAQAKAQSAATIRTPGQAASAEAPTTGAISRVLPSSLHRRIPAVLQRRDFRRFWLGHSVSLVGDEVHRIAMPLAAVLLFGAGATAMSWLTAAPMIPALLLSIPAGIWVDRRPSRRRIMLAADVGRFLVVLSVPVAYACGVLTLAQLIVAEVVVGMLAVLFSISDNTLFAAMVPNQELMQASSLSNGSRAFAYVSGPSLGGLAVQLLTAPFALVADALSYLVSAVSLSRIRPVEPVPDRQSKGGFLAGLRWIAATPGIRALQGAVATVNFFDFIFQALFILYATKYLHINAGLLGLALGAGAIGGLVGAAVTSRVVARIGIGMGMTLGFLGFAAPHVLVVLASGPKLLIVATLFAYEFLSGLGVMVLDICGNAYITAVMPDDLRSRISGVLQTINYGIRPLGALTGGWLATTVGMRASLWISTIGACCNVLFLLGSPLRKLRELPG